MAKSDADQHEGRVAIGESTHHPGAAADLPVEPFNNIVGTDASPVLAGEAAVGQGFLNTVLHLFGGLFQLHLSQLGHHSLGLFTSSFLLSWAWIALSIFATSFTLKRGTAENTLR